MRRSSLKLLFAVTGVSLFLVIVVKIISPDFQGRPVGDDLALDGLAQNINDASFISVVSRAGELTMSKGEAGRWYVEDHFNYPASIRKIQETVLALSRLTLFEKKTVRPELYHRLELNDPGTTARGTGTRLLVMTAKGDVLADLVVGKSVSARSGMVSGGVYVRLDADAQTWLAAGPLDLSVDLKDWIDTAVLTIAPEDIATASIMHPDGETIRLERKDGTLELVDVPGGHVVDSVFRLDGIAGFLDGLGVLDVMRDDGSDEFVMSGTFVTGNGLEIGLELMRDAQESHWVRILASGSGADAVNARTHGWLYRIADWKAGILTRRKADLIRPAADEG